MAAALFVGALGNPARDEPFNSLFAEKNLSQWFKNSASIGCQSMILMVSGDVFLIHCTATVYGVEALAKPCFASGVFSVQVSGSVSLNHSELRVS